MIHGLSSTFRSYTTAQNKGKKPNDTSSEVHSHTGVSTAQQSVRSTSGRSLAYDVQSNKEREAHNILNAYPESPDIVSGPLHGSRFHFRAEDMLKESKEWEARLQYWFSGNYLSIFLAGQALISSSR